MQLMPATCLMYAMVDIGTWAAAFTGSAAHFKVFAAPSDIS